MINFLQNFFTCTLQTNVSDHYATFCCIPNWIGRISNVSKYSFRYHSEENIQALRNELSNWLNMFDIFDEVKINEKFNILNSIIEKTYFEKCQVKTKTLATQKLSKPWITPLRRCIERKHLLHKNSLINPLELADFKRYRNTLRNLFNTAKKSYYHNFFESATDIKTIWRRINSVVRPIRVSPKLKLKINDELVTD